MFKEAGTEQICQSYSTDKEAISDLTQKLSNIIRSIISPRLWIRYHDYLDLVCSVAYFSATTLAGSQTLGEELTSIVSVHKDAQLSFMRRCVSLFLRAIVPHLKPLLNFKHGKGTSTWTMITKAAVFLIPLLRHAHLLYFYAMGRYREISKRVLSIVYVLIRSSPQPLTPYYQLLRVSSGFEFVCRLYHTVMSARSLSSVQADTTTTTTTTTTTDGGSGGGDNGAASKCSLCLDAKKDITSTLCGHTFCWHCILKWSQLKRFCPLCRSEVLPRHLIRIQN